MGRACPWRGTRRLCCATCPSAEPPCRPGLQVGRRVSYRRSSGFPGEPRASGHRGPWHSWQTVHATSRTLASIRQEMTPLGPLWSSVRGCGDIVCQGSERHQRGRTTTELCPLGARGGGWASLTSNPAPGLAPGRASPLPGGSPVWTPCSREGGEGGPVPSHLSWHVAGAG